MAEPGYVPRMPPDQVELIRNWHERAYQGARQRAGPADQAFSHLGLTLRIPPEVHPITGTSTMLGEAILAEVSPDDRVLDMGTGCGVNAILAASAASHVVAVDISPLAVEAAIENASRNAVAERIAVRHSDVFSAIRDEERFDLIIFDPPYRWFAPRDWLEMATADENYQALTAFFAEVGDHFAPGGRMLISFGTSGDIGYLHQLMERHGYAREVVAEDGLARDGQRVDYFVYRVTGVRPPG
jgi:release factor glutamine methyltransferase